MVEDTPSYIPVPAASIEMPRFISCKLVWALKIKAITDARHANCAGVLLHFDDHRYAARFMVADWVEKRGAQAGGYLVQYEDGYLSWSPAKVFEEGNVPADTWGLARVQEPKYTVNRRGKLAKRDDGGELPGDEPLFVLRAQDVHALPALIAYRATLPPNSPLRESLDERVLAFSAFVHAHPRRMKEPDGRLPPPPVPHAINEQPQRWGAGERGFQDRVRGSY